MKRKILSIFLSLAVALTMMPAIVLANDAGLNEKEQSSVETNVSIPTEEAGSVDGDEEISENSNGSENTEDVNVENNEQEMGALKLAQVEGVAQIGDETYPTLQEAVTAAKNGETVKLLQDIEDIDRGTGTQYAYQGIIINKNIKIDLNGKKYTGQFEYGAFIAQRGTLTIIDSSEEKTGLVKNTLKVNSALYAALAATKAGTIIINGGTIEGYAYGIYQYYTDAAENGNTTIINGGEVKVAGYAINAFDFDAIIINGGKVTSTAGYALLNNGSDKNPSNIEINGGKVYGAGEAIYHPGPGTCKITGGTIEGGESGIEMRAGTLNVSGGTIQGNGTPTTVTPNGNGMTSSGAGIAIAQHTTKLPITITINGGTIKGYSAIYESNPQNNSSEDINKVNINIVKGKFECINDGTCVVYSGNKQDFIKGGLYSNILADTYIAENCKAAEITDEPYNYIVGLNAKSNESNKLIAGQFNINPSAYVAEGYGVRTSDNKDYPYEVYKVEKKSPVEILQATTSGKKAVKLSWNSVPGATKYVVYGQKCGKKYKKLKTTTGKTYTVKKIKGKKLKAHKTYKFYVVAYTSNGKVQSNSIHFITAKTQGKYANAKSIIANPSTLTLVKGKAATIKTTTKIYKNKKHIKKNHGVATRFISDCPTVATVSSNGVVTAKAPGTAIIYVQDIGGLWTKTAVTVKGADN